MGSVLVGAASLVVRYRHASGDDRRALRWLFLAVAPVPLMAVPSLTGGRLGGHQLTVLASAVFLVTIPVAAGLAALRFRLYDVDRVVARAIAYAVLSAVLFAVYAAVVLAAADAPGGGLVSPRVSATLGALSAAVLFLPLRSWLQDLLDRRFNRGRHRAEAVVRAALAGGAGIDVDDLLRRALDDDSASVSFVDEVTSGWVGADGRPVPTPVGAVEVHHAGHLVGHLHHDPTVSDPATVRAVADLAAGELDNVRLRAQLRAAQQRILKAQRTERRRIERDLHDGAQQSLLALAFELRAAELTDDPPRMRAALSAGADAAGDAVRRLRELANGLHPVALTDGGLAGAVEELALRSPVPVRHHVQVGRLDPTTEFTAWLVISECLANATKHARASSVRVDASVDGGRLRLLVGDDGDGGARPDGTGLRGLRDRVEAAGGRWWLTSPPGVGTTVEVELPCAS